MQFPALSGARCVLRPLSEQDLPAFARYRADPAVARFQSWSTYSLDDARRLFAGMASVPFGTRGSWYQVAIADKRQNVLLGDCALHFLEDDQQVEIGFTLAPVHQGQGLAGEAVSLLVNYIFGQLHKHRIIAVTDADNTAARKLLAGTGFRQEAHFVQNTYFKGKWGDECLYAMLASEWRVADSR
ncbi:MAG TPA: GNAT family protein [Gammaproteobacteria bacterium]|nr:GNAT family protein [Gammaproteobacteria bacterium]